MTLFRRLSIALALATAVAASAEIDLPTRVVNGKTFYYYEVPPKETIYSITRKFHISREELFKYNPQVIDGLRAGDTLFFPVGDSDEETAERPESETPEEVVADEPAEKTVEIVEEADGVISIVDPVPSAQTVKPLIPLLPVTPEAQTDSEAVNVAVMLPFMLDHENMTRHAQNQTNFYRGALLAVDSLASEANKINLYAFDTEGSADVVGRLMSRPDMADMDFIIAPGDSLSVEIIAAAADSTGATVVNLFGVRNDAHLRHESVLQANIPHDAMYARAGAAFCEQFKNHKVLILNATDIPAEKRSFVDELTQSLVKSGIPYEQIDYAGKLTAGDLESLPYRDYVAIPTSSSREALMKLLPTLTEFATQNPAMDVRLFGYPEWVVLRGDIKDKLHKLNTLVYSRFSTDLDGADVAAVNSSYLKWYGTEPTQSLPDTMLLGFDTVGWLLHIAEHGISSPYTGLQNAFRITELDDAGDVNEALYLINFTRDGRVDAKVL